MTDQHDLQDGQTLRQAVARRIKAWRDERGWSQDTLAHLTGMHRAYPHRIESGLVDLRLSTLERLSAAFGVTVRELVDFEPVSVPDHLVRKE